ncbi:hypothetical protein RhiirA1_474523 [Rhizophagus irregularis]|uniref:Uncharacterized protein n=3 Tax=Rhizophagus irregularis TaxID=588596 RepID=A0A2N0QYE8_9GLOM|nr:hypothetical protein RhiirA1_474523 [Rhizophagus irregularis]
MFNLKVLITFICLISIVSSQNIISRDILSQNGSLQDISPQDISFIYEEPINGLKFYTILPTYNYMMIWMAFEDEDPECMLPYFHLRIINKITGQTNYIDLNYTLPAEAVCPINIDFSPIADNYILLYYAKTTNGIKGKHGMIINYSGEIMSEIYLGNADGYVYPSNTKGFINIEKPDEKGISAWHWYSSPNIVTGEVVEHSSGEFHAPNLPLYTLVDSFNFNLLDGGFIVIYQNATAIDFYLLDDNGNYMQSQGSFGPEFFYYNTYRTINTIFGVKEQAKNKLEFLFKPLPKLKQGSEFSPVIESAKPSINEVIDPLIKEITIKYTIPVKLSTGNVSIFQLNDDQYKPGLLRQTFSGDSKLCTIGSDNHTREMNL